MEIIRLKKENSILEKKKKELLNQIHDLMTKNNSLNQEILSLRYSNKNSGVSHQSNNNAIISPILAKVSVAPKPCVLIITG